jgi:hypothetical protein
MVEMNTVLDNWNLELFKYGGHPLKDELLETSTSYGRIIEYQKIWKPD